MSHFDYISRLAPGFEAVAHTDNCPVAAAQDTKRGLYAIQFHPEVLHTVCGTQMIYNFGDANITEAAFYESTGATAEEIVVLKCNSEADAGAVENALKSRVEEQKESFADYVPEELKMFVEHR